MTNAVIEKEEVQFIECKICGGKVHSIEYHLRDTHKDVTLDAYRQAYPQAELLSPTAIALIEKRRKSTPAAQSASLGTEFEVKPMHELFGIGPVPTAMSNTGNPIPIKVLNNGDFADMVPQRDKGYVLDHENLKNALVAMEFNFPLYVWGHAGTGKTTLIEQICAATNRPLLRVQHTIGTEESNILGQWVIRNKETVFELGPLPLAMKHGWTYLADEYDFGMPPVLAIYQPILEGKALVIKEADAANRVIKPHPNFRFVATGNTNGSGDEHGIYQGTQIQNAANYDRFNVVIQAQYMNKINESKILVNQAGIMQKDAEKFTSLANDIRNDFAKSKLSLPISPRTLIRAAQIGVIKGNFKQGLELAFTNKLSETEKAVVDGYAQRIFG